MDYKKITEKYEEAFFADFKKLNIELEEEMPRGVAKGFNVDFPYPRATEYVEKMVGLINRLLENGIAYKADDGVYFSVDKFADYGKLSGLEKRQLKKGARVNDDLYDKESWSDFALWKFEKPNEPSWDASFGKGRPGWHIECSAMSMDKLGESFDIHCGGVDLLFPHHENEIAQSEAATGKKFVNYWLEGEHLLVAGQKMSKSLGNIYSLADIVKKGFDPIALRYLFLTAHYRSKLNFTWASLEAAQNALTNLREQVAAWAAVGSDGWEGLEKFEKSFQEKINNDLDMPGALAVLWEMVKSGEPEIRKHESLLIMDKILGLGIADVKKAVLSKEAKKLIEKREKLRNEGKFAESDKLRSELLEMGIEVEDTAEGSKWKQVKN